MKRIGKLLMMIGLLILVTAAVARADQRTLTSSTAANTAVRTLRYGDRGEEVARLQSMLAQAGFSPGPIDGAFGPQTERAVRAAQAHFGLVVDGLAGRLTQGALREAVLRDTPTAQSAVAAPVAAPAPEPAVAETTGQLVFYSARTSVRRARFAATPALGSRITAGPEEIAFWSADDAPPAPPAETAFAEPTLADLAARVTPVAEGAALQPLRLFALTFDGEPSPELTPTILATLKRHGMKATFFVSGETAERSGALLATIAAEGHAVENSGYGSFDMTRISEKMMSTQLRLASNAIAAATGRTPSYFRPPTGRFNSKLIQAAGRQNLQFVLWSNVLVNDETDVTPEELALRLQGSVYPGAILMLHQDRPNSVKALDQFLSDLRSDGYQSVVLDGLMSL